MSLAPLISSQRLSLYTSWRRSVQSGFFQHQIPSVSPEELTLPHSARCALSRLRCNGHSTLLNSYLHRVGRAETPSCSNCGSEPQDLSHLVLDCPVLDLLRRAIFGHTLSLLDLWSRPWGVARLLGLRGVDPRPHPQEWVGLNHHHHHVIYANLFKSIYFDVIYSRLDFPNFSFLISSDF